MTPAPFHRRRFLATSAGTLAAWAGATTGRAIDFPFPSLFKKSGDGLEEVTQSPSGPGGLAITPSGDYIVSCHQFFDPTYPVLRLNRDGIWEPFPDQAFLQQQVDSVLGIVCDANGIVWMLDNGRRLGTPAKLIGWDTTQGKTGKLHQIIPLVAPSTLRTSFVRNLAVDPEAPFIYISDPAGGDDAAIIVVERTTGLTRRVLQGHYSVKPDLRIALNLDGRPVEARSADGRPVQPLAGVNPIMVDRKGQWLYFAPMHGGTLYRVQTQFLRDASLDPVQLESKVQSFSIKPICDSIAMDSRGNIYFGDIAGNAIGYATPEENYLKYRYLIQDGRLIWPGGLTFGTDGKLHFFSNQLHRTPIYNGGKDVTAPPFEIFRAKPLPGKGLWPVK